jgi:GntR family transcriptional regulator
MLAAEGNRLPWPRRLSKRRCSLLLSLAKAGLTVDDRSSKSPTPLLAGDRVSFAKNVSTRALYIQVRDHLAHQIAQGALKPGTPLPNELELADRLGVSLGTLRKGLEALEKERLITRRHGRGTFVRDHAVDTPFAFDNLRTKDDERIPFTIQFLGATIDCASLEEQKALELQEAAPVARCQQVRNYKGPFLFEQIALAASRFCGLERAELQQPYQLAVLAQEHGVLVGDAVESLEITQANPTVGALLGVDAGIPLLRLDRIIYSLDRVPLEWRIGYCRLTAVKYVTRLRV